MSAPISPARIDEDLPSDFLPPGNLQVQVPERHRRYIHQHPWPLALNLLFSIGKIVIAYDHSENSDATFAKGIRLGLISPNDHLYIVHIIEQRDLQNLFNASFPGHMDMAAGNQVASTAHSVTEGFMIELKTVLSTNGVSGFNAKEGMDDDSLPLLVPTCYHRGDSGRSKAIHGGLLPGL